MTATTHTSNSLQDEWDVIEDSLKINEKTKKELEEARQEIAKSKFHTLEQVKKRVGL